MNKALIYSIIVPTHNSSRFIRRLLDSIPMDQCIEVIIVDDHSSNSELRKIKDIFDEYKFSHKTFLENEGVQSAGAARNIGIASSNGRWLVFADSDDSFTPDFKKILDRHKNTSASIVYFHIKGNKTTRRVNALNRLLFSGDINQIKYSHIVPWGKLINKDLVEEFNINFSEVAVGNDEFFSAKLGYYAKNCAIDELKGYYSFDRNDSLTAQVHSKSLQDIRMNEVLKKYTFMHEKLGESNLRKIKLSVFPNIKSSVLIGGLAYGARWYLRLRQAGARINFTKQLIGRLR